MAVLDGTSGYGEYKIRDMRPVATVDGHKVVELERCEDWFDGVRRKLFAVPSKGVVFAVTIAEEGDGSYDEIFNSVQILPPAQTVVPLKSIDGWTPASGAEPRATQALASAIENAGHQVVTKEVGPSDGRDDTGSVADLPPGSLLDVEPQLGSVIDKGGTVTLTVIG